MSPSGTAHGVTSDNSDSTYVTWGGSGTALVMQTPVDSPPAGERRHQVRLRVRGEDGSAWWAVRLSSGALTAGASAALPASPATITGSWGFGAPPDGPTVLAAHIEGQTSGMRAQEVYLDVDTRLAPTLAAQVLDGSGTATTTVTDTNTPGIRADAVTLDGLTAMQYRYWVTQGSTIVWDSGIISGTSATLLTSALENGAYTAHVMVWSRLGRNTPNPSDEETLDFTVDTGDVPVPNDPEAAQVPDTPFYAVTVCAPDVSDFDNGQGYVQVQRIHCADSSDPTYTTVGILGPLDTDECTEAIDYTVPRTGIGATCDHPGEMCCFYYRARTVGFIDGSAVISKWSDIEDTGIPNGLIFMWPGTNASIPAGWDRVTDLDGRYPRGITTSATQPGLIGGASTHTHTLPTHIHTENHSHAAGAANTSAGVGGVGSGDGAVGTTAIAATHTHTLPATNVDSVNSGATAVTPSSISNDPARLEVIFIESDGTPAGAPNGALGISGDVSLTGWTDHAAAANRFLKGAAAAGNGGATGTSARASHFHSLPGHTHTGTAHTHSSANTGATTSNLSLFAGANSVIWAGNHSHAVFVNSASTAALATGGADVSGFDSLGTDDPLYRNVRVKENTSGGVSLPIGIVALWRGSLGTIPNHWALCDGTAGTLDLTGGRYPRGATASIGTAGGSASAHDHSSPSHTHTTSGHTHTVTIPAAVSATANVQSAATVTVATAAHTHTASNTASTTPTVGASTSGILAATTTEPPFEEVAFVQLMETPSPEPDPEVFCLTWNDDEHLIRTLTPDGPVWMGIAGVFEWDVDRPFSSAMGVNGTRFVTSAAPGERNHTMTAAVESEEDLQTLLTILERPLVLISPSDSTAVWAAPVTASVKVIKVGRIRQVSADFLGTGPQPEPQLYDVTG